MPGCEDFEIAIEMRLHGALDQDARARLDAHLSSCERCRAFEVMARGTEAVMRGAADKALDGVDWTAVERMVKGVRLRTRLLTGLVVLLGIAVMLVEVAAFIGRGNRGEVLPLMIAAVAVVLAAVLLRRWQTRQIGAGGRSIETIRLLLDELEGRSRLVRVLAVLLPIYAAGCAALAIADAARPLRAWLFGGLAVGSAAAWVFLWFVKRPRLARDRAVLDGAVVSKRT